MSDDNDDDDIREVREEMESLRQTVARLEAEVDGYKDDIADYQDRGSHSANAIEDLESKFASLEAEHEDVSIDRDELEAYLVKVSEFMGLNPYKSGTEFLMSHSLQILGSVVDIVRQTIRSSAESAENMDHFRKVLAASNSTFEE